MLQSIYDQMTDFYNSIKEYIFMLQSIYDQMTDFYNSIEEEYATFFGDSWE